MPRKRNDAQRRAMFAHLNMDRTPKKKRGWSELPDPITGKAIGHQIAALKVKNKGISSKILTKPMIPQNKPMISQNQAFESVIRKSGRFAVPLICSMSGMEDSLLVAKACVNSFEDSYNVYKTTGNIDNAIIKGIKSFVENYATDKVESYVMKDFLLNEYDVNNKYEATLKGTIMMTSLYAFIENI